MWRQLTPRMCHIYGRPPLLDRDESIALARKLLEHPLARADDSRCVVLLEIAALRVEIVHAQARKASYAAIDALVDDILRKVDDWEVYWRAYYANAGLKESHFHVTERE